MNPSELAKALSGIENKSRNALVQRKCQKALADIKRARTLLEKAELTLSWARSFEDSGNWSNL